jgi:nucleoside-diphosphate-sugar epimerase
MVLSPMKVVVIGDNYIGTAFSSYEVLDHHDLVLCDSFRERFSDVDIFIYAVDNKVNRIEINSKDNFLLLYRFTEFCKKFGKKLVLISTADLYGNNWDWEHQTTEDSTALDMNTDYRLSKRVAERMMRPHDIIIRIKNPFDCRLHDENTLLKIYKKTDLCNWQDSFTYLPDLTKSVEYLLNNNMSGIYNVAQFECASMVYISNLLQMSHSDTNTGDILDLVNVCADVNCSKIKQFVDLTSLDAALSVSWQKLLAKMTLRANM